MNTHHHIGSIRVHGVSQLFLILVTHTILTAEVLLQTSTLEPAPRVLTMRQDVMTWPNVEVILI